MVSISDPPVNLGPSLGQHPTPWRRRSFMFRKGAAHRDMMPPPPPITIHHIVFTSMQLLPHYLTKLLWLVQSYQAHWQDMGWFLEPVDATLRAGLGLSYKVRKSEPLSSWIWIWIWICRDACIGLTWRRAGVRRGPSYSFGSEGCCHCMYPNSMFSCVRMAWIRC